MYFTEILHSQAAAASFIQDHPVPNLAGWPRRLQGAVGKATRDGLPQEA